MNVQPRHAGVVQQVIAALRTDESRVEATAVAVGLRLHLPQTADIGERMLALPPSANSGRIAVALLCDSAAKERGRHLRRELQRRIVFDNSVVEASEPKIDKASAVHRVGVVRPEPERLVAIAEGLRKVPARYGARQATVLVGSDKFRIDPDRLIVVRDGAVEVVLGAPSVAAVVVGDGVFRIEPDRLGIVRDGAVVVALGAPRVAAIEVGKGVFRIEPDRLVVVCDSAVEVTLVAPSVAAVAVGDCEVTALVSARSDQTRARPRSPSRAARPLCTYRHRQPSPAAPPG